MDKHFNVETFGNLIIFSTERQHYSYHCNVLKNCYFERPFQFDVIVFQNILKKKEIKQYCIFFLSREVYIRNYGVNYDVFI